MATRPIFDYILALEWANFNIFTWDLFYMIDMHKLHLIAKLELSTVIPPSNTVLGRQEKMPKNRIGRGAVLEGGSPIF